MIPANGASRLRILIAAARARGRLTATGGSRVLKREMVDVGLSREAPC
ncbi:hypothetical protein ACQR16_07925 [Bradyrhizobium oligotrophicum]